MLALVVTVVLGCPACAPEAAPVQLIGVTDVGEAVTLSVRGDRVVASDPVPIQHDGAWEGGVMSNLHAHGGRLFGYDHRSGVLLELSVDAREVLAVRGAPAAGYQRMRGMAVTEGGGIVLLDAPTDGIVVCAFEGGEGVRVSRVDGTRRMEAIATRDDGALFGVGHDSGAFSRTLYAIDLATGGTTSIAELPVPDLDALTFGDDGMLYATDADGSAPARLWRIDARTGACEDLGEVMPGTITALASNPVKRRVTRGCW